MSLIPYNQGQLSPTEYPKHITFLEYQDLRNKIKVTGRKFVLRDLLFVDICWATGARINDICLLKHSDFNFQNNIVTIFMQKVKKYIKITLDNELLKDLANYCLYSQIKGSDRIFKFGRQAAWEKLKRYGSMINLDLHPHKFRHGLAIYLMLQGVQPPVISARLGHSNVFITWQMYNKVTPEIQKEALKNIKWR